MNSSERTRKIKVMGIRELVEVSEEYYQEQKRENWRLRDRMRREGRCTAYSYRNCYGDCEQCKFYSPVYLPSLDEMYEQFDDEHEVAVFEAETQANIKELQKAVRRYVAELDGEAMQICQAVLDKKPDRVAAKELGMATMTYNDHKRKLFAALREEWEELYQLLGK